MNLNTEDVFKHKKKNYKGRKLKLNKIKKILLIIIIFIANILVWLNSVKAGEINYAGLYSLGDCGNLLTYKGVNVITSYIEYTNNGEYYPAYCLDKTKPGVETNAYGVSVEGAITDVGLWRRVINGYPYKTIEELGVANKQEAFTATKQAIYCYIHGNNPDDYAAIGEAGQRTLNAMKTIMQNAQNSNESKITSTIKINKNLEDWKQDSIDKDYVSKVYSVSAGAPINNYKIKIFRDNNRDLGGIKLTNEKNIEKNEFAPNEKFKILIPIKNMTEDGSFNIEVESKIETKPILYGSAPDSQHQDYALAVAKYEDGKGNVKDQYNKNETQIKIIKQDQETNERLEGVEFELLDENKNTVYNELKTNEQGEIIVNNLVPGVYYIKEVNSKDGYKKLEDLVKVEVKLNEIFTITINNNKEEKPTVEIGKDKLIISNKTLPVTGM